jgi:hypothetical protein
MKFFNNKIRIKSSKYGLYPVDHPYRINQEQGVMTPHDHGRDKTKDYLEDLNPPKENDPPKYKNSPDEKYETEMPEKSEIEE